MPVPIDVATVSATASGAFAFATPLRVDRLLILALNEALGARAPQDKRNRELRRALEGFSAGKFVVDIDGRIYRRPDDVVMCSGTAVLRFFSTERHARPVSAH